MLKAFPRLRSKFSLRPSKAKADTESPTLSLKDHTGIRAVDPYGYEVFHIRQAWLFRVSIMTNLTLLIVILFLIGSFNAILPMKEVRIALVRADETDNRIYRIEPIHQDVDGFDLLLEVKAKEFLEKLLSVNLITQEKYLKDAFIMASKTLGRRFTENRIESGAIQDLIDKGIRRQIEFVSVDHMDSLAPGVHKLVVDFIQRDYSRTDKLIQSKALRAYLSITPNVNQVPEAQKYENPLGLIVTDMSVQPRQDKTKTDDE